MKRFVVVALLVSAYMASASAAGLAYIAASPYRTVIYPHAHVYSAHSSSLITPSQQQYHTQDEFGQYAYGYNEPLSAKQEVRSLDGITRGSYSYRDAEGKLQTVAYTADSNGFHVAATNLPRSVVPEAATQKAPAPVADTVEVAAARTAHLAAYEATKLRLAGDATDTAAASAESRPTGADYVRRVELPKPVEDTPAVAAAKAQHLERVKQETLRNEIIGSTYHHQQPTTIIRSAAALPSVYGYGYSPLNARILASGYYY